MSRACAKGGAHVCLRVCLCLHLSCQVVSSRPSSGCCAVWATSTQSCWLTRYCGLNPGRVAAAYMSAGVSSAGPAAARKSQPHVDTICAHFTHAVRDSQDTLNTWQQQSQLRLACLSACMLGAAGRSQVPCWPCHPQAGRAPAALPQRLRPQALGRRGGYAHTGGLHWALLSRGVLPVAEESSQHKNQHCTTSYKRKAGEADRVHRVASPFHASCCAMLCCAVVYEQATPSLPTSWRA